MTSRAPSALLRQWLTIAASCAFIVATRERGGAQADRRPAVGDVVRFLEQTTFGPTAGLIAKVREQGLEAFLAEQFATTIEALPSASANADHATRRLHRRLPAGQLHDVPAAGALLSKCDSGPRPTQAASGLGAQSDTGDVGARRHPLELDATVPATPLSERVRELPSAAL